MTFEAGYKKIRKIYWEQTAEGVSKEMSIFLETLENSKTDKFYEHIT